MRSAKDLWGKARLEPSNSSSSVWANQPLSAAERSLLLEQNELIAFVGDALKFIHEANEGAEIRQLGIVENLRVSWLWDFDFMMLNQWNLDTVDDEGWTDVDYQNFCAWEAWQASSAMTITCRSGNHGIQA